MRGPHEVQLSKVSRQNFVRKEGPDRAHKGQEWIRWPQSSTQRSRVTPLAPIEQKIKSEFVGPNRGLKGQVSKPFFSFILDLGLVWARAFEGCERSIFNLFV
jgi:hypothetical protein